MNKENKREITNTILRDVNIDIIKYGKSLLLELLGIKLSFNEIKEISPALQEELLSIKEINLVKRKLITNIKKTINKEFENTNIIDELSIAVIKRMVKRLKSDAIALAMEEIKLQLFTEYKEEIKLEILGIPEIQEMMIKKL